jgi:hypothetical protein
MGGDGVEVWFILDCSKSLTAWQLTECKARRECELPPVCNYYLIALFRDSDASGVIDR